MIVFILISFFLESIVSNYINYSSIFIPLFTLTSIVFSVSYFQLEKEYFKICILFGFLYDITFSNTLFINSILFLIIGFITKIINYYLPNNILNNIISLIINIIFYRISIYLICVLANILDFNLLYLFKSIYSSLIINIIYIVFIYIILNLRKNKKYLNKF